MKPTSPQLPIILVDDESTVLLSSKMVLASAGIKNIETIQDSRELMARLARQEVAVVVLDLFMPYISGSQLLPKIKHEYPDLPVIVMTANQDVATAVASMKEGAFDYLVKPVEESRFVSSIKRALELRTLRRQMDTLKRYLISDELEHGEVFASIVTVSRKMRALFQYLDAVAVSSEPVLITGETGVGKELLAEAVHRLSGRTGEFVSLNTAGLDDALFSDTLFGHRKGAYSGAETAREGMVSRAAGGTLFLDEIGDLKPSSQVKLLRLLQERQYYPLGSDVAKISDLRIVCATNRDLGVLMNAEEFRSDLYFRLSVHQVEVPPLRERQEDIALLVSHFIEEAAEDLGKNIPKVPPELLTLLTNHHFPGNVRELRAMIFDAVARQSEGHVLSTKYFHHFIKTRRNEDSVQKSQAMTATKNSDFRFPTLKEAEQMHIEAALKRANNNQGIAATLLGISRPALNRRLARTKQENEK